MQGIGTGIDQVGRWAEDGGREYSEKQLEVKRFAINLGQWKSSGIYEDDPS